MKVVVDPLLCEANGVCTSIAPEVFELRADDSLIVRDPTPAEALREAVERAVASCPRAALRIEAD